MVGMAVFVKRELFGGAITADVPVDFVDISAVRQVPDNQECYAHPDSDKSLIVEILEYEGGQKDEDAASFFFHDLADANGSQETVIEQKEVKVDPSLVPCQALDEQASVGVVIGTQRVAKFRESATNQVRVFLASIRLPKYTTDILVSLNAPVVVDPKSSSASALQASGLSLKESPEAQAEELQVFLRFLNSFEIVNPALFGV